MRDRRAFWIGILVVLAGVALLVAYGDSIERWLLALHGVRH
jgi:hypothetical protein